MRPPTSAIAAFAALFCCLSAAPASAAQQVASPSWHEVKCTRYGKAWTQALVHLGTQGLGADFLRRHAAFLASGCTAKADVCPRSPEELKLANVMVILSMDAGTASTFPPFACPAL